MKLKYKNLGVKIKVLDSTPNTIHATFSTSGIDRHGEIVDQKTWKLDEYLTNPVVLFSHNHDQPAIAKVINFGFNPEGNLEGDIQFAVEEYDFAKTIYNLYVGGYMRAFSVGFTSDNADVMGDNVVLKNNTLYELSAVNVPANAMALAKQKGIDTSPLEKKQAELATKGGEGSGVVGHTTTGNLSDKATNLPTNDPTKYSAQEKERVDNGGMSDREGAVYIIDKSSANTDNEIQNHLEDVGLFDSSEASNMIENWHPEKGDAGNVSKKADKTVKSNKKKEIDTDEEETVEVEEDEEGEEVVPPVVEETTTKKVKKTTKKGAVANEIAADNAMDAKCNWLEDVYEVTRAFYDLVYSQDTTVDQLPALLKETSDLLASIADGTYSDEDDDTTDTTTTPDSSIQEAPNMGDNMIRNSIKKLDKEAKEKFLADLKSKHGLKTESDVVEVIASLVGDVEKAGKVLSTANHNMIKTAVQSMTKIIAANGEVVCAGCGGLHNKSVCDGNVVTEDKSADITKVEIKTVESRIVATVDISKKSAARDINKAIRALLAQKRKV